MMTSLQPRVERVAKPLSGDEPRAGKIEIEKAQNSAPGQSARELFERLEFAGHVAAPDHGADRCARDDVRKDAGLVQGAQHADVRPAAGGPATQCQTNFATAHASPHAALATDRASSNRAPRLNDSGQGLSEPYARRVNDRLRCVLATDIAGRASAQANSKEAKKA